jgi:hypothetical protein
MELIKQIKPTVKDWSEAKTEAIDFSRPFLWVDDDLYPDERRALIEHRCLQNWVEVDLSVDEDYLLRYCKDLPRPVMPQ